MLIILVAPVVTLYLFMKFEKTAIRREIKWKMIAGIDPEELVLLKFTKEETETKLRWEHSKEFEFEGQMYDIVSKEVKGDSIFYRCWWDHEETKLNKSLKKLVANALDTDGDSHKAQKNLHTYLWSLFYTGPIEWNAPTHETINIVFQDCLNPSIFNSLNITPPSPPPKIG